MADGDLIISFKTQGDAAELIRGFKGVKLSAEDMAEAIVKAGGNLKDVFNDNYTLVIGARVDGLQEVIGYKRTLTETEKITEGLTRSIERKNKADQGSLTNLRQSLNQAKQLLASMSTQNAAYSTQTQRVNQLTEALKRAQGIEAGSIADIGSNVKDLERRLQVENLSADARQRLTNEINEYNVAAQRSRGIEAGSISDLRQQQQEQERLAQSFRIGSAEQEKAAKSAKAFGDQIAAATPKTFSLIGALNKIATVQAGITAITTSFGQVAGSIDQVVKRLKTIEAFDLALQNIGLSAVESSRYFAQAAAAADKLGAPVEQIEKAYIRITPSLRGIGATAAETDKFVEGLAARTQVLGLSAEESGRLMEAFAQVLSKGKLQGEELNQQISELDGAFRGQLADALGVTTAELGKMVEAGEVTSDVFYKAFNTMQNGADLLASKLKNGNATIQQLQNAISNLNVKTLGEIGKVIEPGIKAFLSAAGAFNLLVSEIVSSPLGELLGQVFNEIGATVNILINIIRNLANVFLVLINPIAKLLQLFTPLISILLTLKTGFIAYALAVKGAALATALLNKQLPATAISAINLQKTFIALGGAMRALYNVQLIQFFVQLRTSVASLLLAMNIPVINSFVNALGGLTKARAAGAAVDAVSIASQGLGGGLKGLGGSLLQNVAGLSKVTKAARGTTLMYGDISLSAANAASKFKGVTGTFGGLPKVLASTTKSAGITDGALQSLANASLPSLAKGTKLASAGLATGTVGAANFGKVLLGLGKFTVVGAVVTTALQGLLQVFEGLSEGGSQAKKPLGDLEGTLRQLGIQTKTTQGAWLGFLDDLRKIPGVESVVSGIQQIGDKLKALGLASGGDRGLSNLAEKFTDIESAAKKAGVGGLTDFANASKLNKQEATSLVGGLRATETAYEQTAANIETQIAALKTSGGATADQIAVLERQKEAAESGANRANYYASEWEKATETQRKSADAVKETTNALQSVQLAQTQYFNSIDAEKQAQINALQDQYNKGLIDGSSFASQSAKLQEESTSQKLAAIAKEKAALEDRAKSQTNVDYAAYKRIQELTQQELALKTGAAVQTKQLSEEEIKALQDRQKEVEALAGIYKDLGSSAAGAVTDLGSGVGSALDSLASAIKAQAVIDFTITGDQSFLDESLANQGKILDFQYTIGALKIRQQQSEKQFELELQKLKIQTALIEAQSKAAGGDPIAQQQVAAYQKQLAIIPQIQAANQITSDAALLGLQAETQEKQAQLNAAREAQGLPPVNIIDLKSAGTLQNEFNDVYGKAKAAASEIGNAATSGITEGTQKLQQGITGVNSAVAGTAGSADKARTAFEQSVASLEQGLKKLTSAELTKGLQEGGKKGGQAFNAEIKKSPALIDKAAKSTKALEDGFLKTVNPIKAMGEEVKQVTSLVNHLNGAVGRMPSGGGARALGGPVAGGQSYLVNDGGGRESFMNKAGQISMLPAGRNIQWRAPKDGFVLPAPMTASLVQNSQINAKIAAVNNSGPARTGSAYSSGLSNSGNLIQQMGAMMGGATNQRITNNVTIQSQTPVMDASRIMANVARLKARRGLRG